MSAVPRAAVPRLIKGLTQLNDDGQILVDRDALAMLAAVDGRANVGDLARIHGVSRTKEGLTKLLTVGAVRFEVHSPPIASPSSNRTSESSDCEHARTRRGGSRFPARLGERNWGTPRAAFSPADFSRGLGDGWLASSDERRGPVQASSTSVPASLISLAERHSTWLWTAAALPAVAIIAASLVFWITSQGMTPRLTSSATPSDVFDARSSSEPQPRETADSSRTSCDGDVDCRGASGPIGEQDQVVSTAPVAGVPAPPVEAVEPVASSSIAATSEPPLSATRLWLILGAGGPGDVILVGGTLRRART